MRTLATWPGWSWQIEKLAAWPGAFEQYFDDHLFAHPVIDWRSVHCGPGFASHTPPHAGKNDWLFYADDGGLRDWVQSDPFPEDELADWTETLMKRRAFLTKRGIPYLFVIAPDKQMIYSEHMPDTLHRLRSDYRADQLMAYMRKVAPDFEFLTTPCGRPGH
jgi:hypothetical protein